MELESQGEIIPALDTMPELYEDLAFYWRAFIKLSTSRQSGFGMGYIPYSEIVKYLNENHITVWQDRLE